MGLYEKLLAATEARRVMVIIEGDEVWVTPLAVGDQSKIRTMYPDDNAMALAEACIQKVRDAEGKPVFTAENRAGLARKIAGDLVAPMINAIYGNSAGAQAAEMTSKNLEADDQTST